MLAYVQLNMFICLLGLVANLLPLRAAAVLCMHSLRRTSIRWCSAKDLGLLRWKHGYVKGISNTVPLMLPATGASGCQAPTIAGAAPLPAAAGLYAEPQAGAVRLARPALATDPPTHPCTATVGEQPTNLRFWLSLAAMQPDQNLAVLLMLNGL